MPVPRRQIPILIVALFLSSSPRYRRYTDNDSWSTNELDIDWQGVTLYNLYFARWWAAGVPTRAALPSVLNSASKGDA